MRRCAGITKARTSSAASHKSGPKRTASAASRRRPAQRLKASGNRGGSVTAAQLRLDR